MENDVLRNKIAPWQEKGRWYHAHCTEAGLDPILSDKFITDNISMAANSAYMTFTSKKYTCVEYCFRINKNSNPDSNVTTYHLYSVTTNGYSRIQCFKGDSFASIDYDVWLFVVETENV